MATSILVVDDEPKILDVVRRYLERDGHRVRLARDGHEALASFRAEPPSLVVLDLMLPGIDGWHVCREIRRESHVPIVMLTARAEEGDTLLGLDIGADDYVTKPFSPRELAARVRTVLRRSGHGAPRAPARFRSGDLVIDAERHEATWRSAALPLTRAELRLLLALVSAGGRVLSRAQLAERALGDDFDGGERTIDAHIKNLRSKLKTAGVDERIETVRGVGYRARTPVDAA